MRLESDAEAITMAADGLKQEVGEEKQEGEEKEKEEEEEGDEEEGEREGGGSRPMKATMSSLLGSFQSKAGSSSASFR
jgi:hypothetical protein